MESTRPVPSAADEPPRALYRRWRSQRFGELLGQDPITATLRNAIAADRPAHAYLFVGPRGTGKTSTARILAKALNCTNRGEDGEPCDACQACVSIREGRALDVIEIDAASHGLVEDARELVMRALTAPTELRRRVYIIDEVHMLSTHAFNALLKLVEEPPDHVVFILATTDTHKVPATIISRTQRFDFRRLPDALIVEKLGRITAAEGAVAEPAALGLLARLADGGMRDAESLLDQALAYGGEQLTEAAVREAVGLAEDEAIDALVDAYESADVGAALGRIASLIHAGRDVAQVAAQAEREARSRLLAAASDPLRAARLATRLRTVAEAAGAGAREGRARLSLELLAVEVGATPASAAPSVETAPPARAAAEARAAAQARPAAPVRPAAAAREESPEHRAAPPPASPTAAEPASGPMPVAGPERAAVPVGSADRPTGERPSLETLRARWAEIAARATPVIKPLLKECRPIAVDGARLTLAFPEGREFMRSRISSRSAAIEALVGQVIGGTWAIECVASNIELEPLSVEAALAPDGNDPEARALLDNVLKITGGELVDAPEVR